MFKPRNVSMLAVYMLLMACVTVNVYFPAAAAEKAADLFIRDIYGEQKAKTPSSQDEKATPEVKPGAWLDTGKASTPLYVQLLDLLLPQAQAAAPDIDISSPAINQLQSSMRSRHQQLTPFYNNGAVGMTDNGLLDLRDASAVPLKERNLVKQLLAEENRDRNQLYREVSAGNGHPEWEAQIRSIFARRWIGNAPGGWWFQNAQGGWQKK
jgi:uncharacterized protein YdbL (DUF1318 family)